VTGCVLSQKVVFKSLHARNGHEEDTDAGSQSLIESRICLLAAIRRFLPVVYSPDLVVG
jgi:hypothetical protein